MQSRLQIAPLGLSMMWKELGVLPGVSAGVPASGISSMSAVPGPDSP